MMECTYGSTSANYIRRTAERLDRDVVFVKLLMSLLIFSTFDWFPDPSRDHSMDLSDAKTIVNLQNRYIELMWRYLVHRDDDQRAVRCFSNLLRAEGPLRAGKIVAQLNHISQPAVSKHLRILREAQLVSAVPDDRERAYHLNPAALRQS